MAVVQRKSTYYNATVTANGTYPETTNLETLFKLGSLFGQDFASVYVKGTWGGATAQLVFFVYDEDAQELVEFPVPDVGASLVADGFFSFQHRAHGAAVRISNASGTTNLKILIP